MAVEKKGREKQQVRDDRLYFEGQAAKHQRCGKTKRRRKISETPISRRSVAGPLQEQEYHTECQHDEGEKVGEIILHSVLPDGKTSL
ncbi:hypothetical protein D3C80_2029870 [compost metagenome]